MACCPGSIGRTSWTTGLVSLAGGQTMPTWLGLTPVTGRVCDAGTVIHVYQPIRTEG